MYSQALKRNIEVPIELLNRVDEAEFRAALSTIPGYPDIGLKEIRDAAAKGSMDARYILQRADKGNEFVRDWLGL